MRTITLTKTEKRIIILLVVVVIVNTLGLVLSFRDIYDAIISLFTSSIIIEILVVAVLILMIRKE